MGKKLILFFLLMLFAGSVMSLPTQNSVKIQPNNEKQNISNIAKDVLFGTNFGKFVGYISLGIPAESLEISPNEKLLAILSQRKLF